MPTYTPAESAMSSKLLGADFTRVSTTGEFRLGTREETIPGNAWVYVKATGTRAQYDVCMIDENYNLGAGVTYAAAGSGASVLPLGVPQSTGFVSGSYGWVKVKGNITVNIAGAVVDGAKVYTTGTAGQVDDSSGTQSQISNATFASTAASGTAVIFAHDDIAVNG